MTVQAFLLNHLKAMQEIYEVYVITNTVTPDFLQAFGIQAKVIPLRIERKISLWTDLRAMFSLFLVFRQNHFDLVHSVTPKAGLLSMMAGCFAFIPIRLHTFTGQVWATRSGLGRFVLKNVDRLLGKCATHLLVDSVSQKEFLVHEHVLSSNKATVLVHGSISGVNTERFKPNPISRRKIRQQIGIAETGILFLFLGRLTKDKGILDLVEAFTRLRKDNQEIHLLLVGPDEDAVQKAIREVSSDCIGSINFVGFTNTPEAYMAAADVFCLPSYREGFGSVIIEAACVGIPAIGSRIYGIVDAIEDGKSGLLHDAKNVQDLLDKMRLLASDSELRGKMGRYAQNRAKSLFPTSIVTAALLEYYQELLPETL
ncbi:glycosyltransferase family 4 protein [Sulfurirhabdus autotrophica]|uniref:Glycosyltransferase involved in cell wall biosynthesis n=1 Tax=Sulfurirhabdus autotrophica TaxID=1706046 RepID=A0A4R3Y0V4_9PROT|nr:glycosyltransferase involved in cell wall biosynthesis [Sulfurirhabdus autotrophica]